MNEDQLTGAAEREMDLYRDEITRLQADIASLTDQRNRVSDTADRLREQLAARTTLLATVLGEFTKGSDGCHARVSQVTLAKRKLEAGMEITDADRKMIGGG